jgi:hypothetical protein
LEFTTERLRDRLRLNRDERDRDLLFVNNVDFDREFDSEKSKDSSKNSESCNKEERVSLEERTKATTEVAVNLSVRVAEKVGVDPKTELLVIRFDELIDLVFVKITLRLKLLLLLNSTELEGNSEEEKRDELLRREDIEKALVKLIH